MHTWQVHVCVCVCIYTLIDTYSTYIVGRTADNLRGGRGNTWILGSDDCDKSSLTKFYDISTKSEDITLISENFIRSLNKYVCVDLNNEQSW